MRARGRACGQAGRRGEIIIAVIASLAMLVLVGCGSSSFPNEPRAAAPIEVTASVGPRSVKVSPTQFGAGLVNFTVANLSSNPASFELRGPTSASSGPIQPGAVTTVTKDLKTGTYKASAGQESGLATSAFKVGPPRRSSQNKLLLP
jgi:hypothetical protein